MEIILAKSAGFCFGVERAMNIIYDNIKKQDGNLFTLGPIIHNKQVVDELYEKGVQAIESLDEVIDENASVVIRTHGIGKKKYEDIEKKEMKYIDATCPYVKKIHRIVQEHYCNNYQIVIIGDPNHPEVQGINGWCEDTAIILNKYEDIEKKFKSINKVCVVAQTTIRRKKWDIIAEYLKINCTDIIFFDTICNATNLRQTEAREIAQNVDVMVVIGGMHSSNTRKLAEVSKQYCKNTYHIETFEALPEKLSLVNMKVGITAGASTPACIIKEVINKMVEKENVQTNSEEMSFEEAFEQSLVTLNTGDIIKGTVISLSSNEVYVDLGYKSDGIISMSELTNDPSQKIEDIVKVGDEIEVFIVRVNDGEGHVLLSKKKVDMLKGWDEIETAAEEKSILEGKIIQVVNGGVIAIVNGIRVFIPASQISDRYVSDLNIYMNQNVSLQIIDINKRKRKVVGSSRIVLEAEKAKKAEAFWNEIEVGKKYTGTVKKLMKFGAFVDLGALDGLIHISELSWSKIKHPSEVLKEGDLAEVYILDFDKEKNKISLGFKKAEDNPWEIVKSKFNVDDVIKCKVVRLVPFGAFVELLPGVDGLIHISQISNKRIGKPEDVLTIGQEVEAKILELDLEKQKISLSIRALLPDDVSDTNDDVDENKEDKLPTEYTEDVKVTIGDAITEKSE